MCQQDFLTTGDVLPIFNPSHTKKYMAEVQEILIINMMEVDDDAEGLF
jgi:hypothetical protein